MGAIKAAATQRVVTFSRSRQLQQPSPTMNKSILLLVVPCVIAMALIVSEVQGQYGVSTPYALYGGSSYQAQALAQRNRLNNLARVSEFSKFINYIPLVLLLTTLTNNTALPIIG